MIRFPNRPTHLFDRARDLGDMLAEGKMSFDSVMVVCHHMAQMDNTQDKRGLEARLCWTASDHAEARAQAIWRAHRELRYVVGPLLNVGASKAVIEKACVDYNESHGSVLRWDRDIIPILRDEVRKFHARARWQK